MRKLMFMAFVLLAACSNPSSQSSEEQSTEQVKEATELNKCDFPNIKGSSRTGKKIYYVPDVPYFAEIEYDELFCTENEAVAAGYKMAIENDTVEVPEEVIVEVIESEPENVIAVDLELQGIVNSFISAFENPFNDLKTHVNQFNTTFDNGDYQSALKYLDKITPTVDILKFESDRIRYKEFERHYRTISNSLTEMSIRDGSLRILLGNNNPSGSFAMYNTYEANIQTIEYTLESLKVDWN